MSGDPLLYVYAIVDAAPPDLGPGLDGAPLRSVAASGMAAVVSEHDGTPEATEEALWEHEALVERLMEDVTVLPLRFGTTVPGVEELEALLRSRKDEFEELFTQVRGAVELSVRAELPAVDSTSVPGGETASALTGTEYMRDRGRVLHSRDQAQERLHEPLSALARRSEAVERGAGADTFKGVYLVDADRVEPFAELVGRLGEELRIDVSCTGPWPPFSFVSGAVR